MELAYIKITDCCVNYQIEPSFVHSLENHGLLRTTTIEGERFITEDQLRNLERYINWHYEMDINIEGIDALRNILSKMEKLHTEISLLREKLHIYE